MAPCRAQWVGPRLRTGCSRQLNVAQESTALPGSDHPRKRFCFPGEQAGVGRAPY